MTRAQGTIKLNMDIEPRIGAPLDARQKVNTKADLTNASSFPYPYVGMEVYCAEDGIKYQLTALPVTTLENWKDVAAGSNLTLSQPYKVKTWQNDAVNIEDALSNAKQAILNSNIFAINSRTFSKNARTQSSDDYFYWKIAEPLSSNSYMICLNGQFTSSSGSNPYCCFDASIYVHLTSGTVDTCDIDATCNNSISEECDIIIMSDGSAHLKLKGGGPACYARIYGGYINVDDWVGTGNTPQGTVINSLSQQAIVIGDLQPKTLAMPVRVGKNLQSTVQNAISDLASQTPKLFYSAQGTGIVETRYYKIMECKQDSIDATKDFSLKGYLGQYVLGNYTQFDLTVFMVNDNLSNVQTFTGSYSNLLAGCDILVTADQCMYIQLTGEKMHFRCWGNGGLSSISFEFNDLGYVTTEPANITARLSTHAINLSNVSPFNTVSNLTISADPNP